MRLTFIRHTTVIAKPGTCYGWSNLDTASSFPDEAAKVAASLSEDEFDSVYSSPLYRCVKLANYCGFEPILDDRLKELNFGNWELKQWNDIKDPQLEKWYKDWIKTPTNGGESFLDQYNRVTSFIEDIKRHYKENVCIFTHRGVITCALIYAGECDLEHAFEHDIAYGSKTVITIK